MTQRNLYSIPIKVGIIFSIFTLILFQYGPYDYTKRNVALFWVLIAIYNIAMYLGFVSGAKKKYVNRATVQFPVKKILNVLFWVALLVSVPMFLIMTGSTSEGLSISRIMYGLSQIFESASDLYADKQSLKSVTGIWRYLNYLVVLCSPLHWAYLNLSMLFWKYLSNFKKIGTLLVWVLYLLQYITTGTNVGIFMFVVNFTVMSLIRRIYFPGHKSRIPRRIKVVLPVAIAAILLVFVFDTIMGSRIGDQYDDKSSFNENSILLKMTPPSLQPVLSYFTGYLAAPYTAMQMSLDEPFNTTFGLGSSFYLLDEIDPGRDGLWQRTYNMKINNDFNYDFYANWHTPYVWFANDVSFWGVPIVLFFLLYFFGRHWRIFVESGNLFSLLVFMLFVTFMMFVSTNNQIFQTVSMLASFWLLLIFGRWSQKYRWDIESVICNGKI